MSVDVLVVSLGATEGLRTADRELAGAIERAGADVAVVTARAPRPVRTYALTDLAWAHAARRAAQEGLSRHAPRAVIYSSVTAALLWPRAGAIRFDACAAGNRAGRHGVWQRPLERRRLACAPLLLPWSEGALLELGLVPPHALVVPVPVEPSGSDEVERDVTALTYATHPHKKGFDRVLRAWRQARRPGEELVVAGLELSHVPPGVRALGRLDRAAYRALLRRTRVFVTAPRREDHGIAQLEALADGCMLVTTEAPGPYAALPIARALDDRLVGPNIAGALRAALDTPLAGYGERARALLEPLRREHVDELVARRLLPVLLSG